MKQYKIAQLSIIRINQNIITNSNVTMLLGNEVGDSSYEFAPTRGMNDER